MDKNKMIAEVDLRENAVLMVRDGELVKVDTPGVGFGKQVITWQNNRPAHVEISYTKK
ncbi:DUF3954 domain-containing protein [Piscibacillus sp. B03]|uniref:DUF3954 domain-containing protein n=1 Tax=Piscibacillus sp. B03 TaxID=3457430 RepID=UPI003FCDD872